MTISRTAPASLMNDAAWIEEVWDGMFLEHWYAESPIPKLCNTKTLDKIKNVGQTIHFRVEPRAAVVPHIKDQPIQWQVMKADKRSITVDYAYSAAHRLDRIDKQHLGSLPVMSKIAASITKTHAEKEAEIFFSVLPTLSFNPLNIVDRSASAAVTGTRSSGLDYAINQVAKLRTAFNRRRAPKKGRFLAVSPEVEELLITSDQVTFNINGVGNEKAITEGEWGTRVCGFDIIPTEFVQGAGTQASPYLCVAGVKDAIGFGRQVVEMEQGIKLQDYYGEGVRALNTFGMGLLYPDGVGLWKVRV